MAFLGNVRSLTSSIRKLKDPELMDQLITLQTSVIEFQSEQNRLRGRIGELEKENETLKNKLTIHGSLTVNYGAYFPQAGDTRDGPFCTRCWDVDNKLVRLDVSSTGTATCPECKYSYDYKWEQGEGAINVDEYSEGNSW